MKHRKLIGGSLVALGLVVAGVSAYNAWGQDWVSSMAQSQLASQYGPNSKNSDATGSQSQPVSAKTFIDPEKATHLADIFGEVYIPRLGDKWSRLVAEGVKWQPVLNEIGIGHYPTSQMPGEVGNFAVAAHRGGFGGAFRDIHRIKTGDHVYVLTNQGWFDYEYMQTKIVKPSDVDVINPVPKELKGAIVGGQYMTLTSCTPIFVNTNRIIVWLKLVGTRTLQQGPPPEIANSVAGG